MSEGYVALIHVPAEGGGQWGVTFPDVPGCTSCGDDFESVVDGAREALSGHLAALRSDGDLLPSARKLVDLLAEDPTIGRMDGSGYPMMVHPRMVPGERIRVNIMMDKGVQRMADEFAEARGWTRSTVIEKALESYLGI